MSGHVIATHVLALWPQPDVYVGTVLTPGRNLRAGVGNTGKNKLVWKNTWNAVAGDPVSFLFLCF